MSEYIKPLDTIGDLIPIKEWKESVRQHVFIDYDGYGRAVKDGKMTNRCYYPSEARDVPEDATHMMWYNK